MYCDAGFSEAVFRNLIARAEATAKHPDLAGAASGFLAVIVRPPGQRKVLLDRIAFQRWLESGRNPQANASVQATRLPSRLGRSQRR